MTHVVSFRTTASSHRKLQRLRATFPEAQWGEMFRWMFDHPDINRVLDERLAEESPAGADGSWGIENSLPVGDR